MSTQEDLKRKDVDIMQTTAKISLFNALSKGGQEKAEQRQEKQKPLKEKTIGKVIEIPCEMITPNPRQPRRSFDETELAKLSASVRQDGILQPLTVRRNPDGKSYEIVSGERRLRAARLCGLLSVPCIVVEMNERTSALMALVENIQRQDLSFFDEAIAIEKLIDFYGMTQEDAAMRLGMAQSTLANKLRLLKLSDEEREAVSAYNLTERHARALLRVPSELRMDVINRAGKFGLNVDKTEAYIEELLRGEKEKESYRKRSVILKDVKLFMNTVSKAVETMQMAGVRVDAKKVKSDGYIEYLIKIPVSD